MTTSELTTSAIPTGDVALSVRDLKAFFYTSKRCNKAVNGVSFEIRKGKTLCIVGESGCGKSVTAAAIMQLLPSLSRIEQGEIIYHSERGDIRLDSLDRNGKAMRSIRGAEISMIFQDPMTALNPVFTIGFQIMENLRYHTALRGRQLKDKATDLLRAMGIPAPERRVDQFPHQYSGGMRQRAMIAMALACRPAVLVADEPTTALDVTIQAQILELLQRLQAELGMTVLLITHDLGVVARTTRRVAVMYLGQVVEETTTMQLFDSPMHPYTQGLLGSVPRLGSRHGKRRKLPAMQGSVPPALAELPGCAFHPRCPKAIPGLCDSVKPAMAEIAAGHKARCLLYPEVLAASTDTQRQPEIA